MSLRKPSPFSISLLFSTILHTIVLFFLFRFTASHIRFSSVESSHDEFKSRSARHAVYVGLYSKNQFVPRLPTRDWKPKHSDMAKKPGMNHEKQSGKYALSISNGGMIQLISDISRHIEKHKVYPDEARLLMLEGDVTMRFALMPDGNISDITIVKKSEFDFFNESALSTLLKSAPFPDYIRKQIAKKTFFQIQIKYRLN